MERHRAVTPEESAAILRLHHAEEWPVGTIAAQLGRHHDTVERVLAQSGLPVAKPTARARLVEPYLPFIHETLAKHPRLRASRLWAMVKKRGYTGSKSAFRAIIGRQRPRPHAEAYLHRAVLAGQEAQVDWAHFGKLTVGRAQRDLWAFVMVLAYSRLRFLRFGLRAAMPSFLRGHVESFRFFNAVPRVILYDNLKSAVLEREGDAVRFHPTLLALAGHYRFEPRACAPYRPNEKGRVERAIQDVRDNFFAARDFASVADRRRRQRRSAGCLAAVVLDDVDGASSAGRPTRAGPAARPGTGGAMFSDTRASPPSQLAETLAARQVGAPALLQPVACVKLPSSSAYPVATCARWSTTTTLSHHWSPRSTAKVIPTTLSAASTELRGARPTPTVRRCWHGSIQ